MTDLSPEIRRHYFVPAINPPIDRDREFWLDFVEPEERLDWRPRAVEITSLKNDEAVWKTRLHSASLPLLFRRRWLGRKPVIDGGVTDKTPLLPAVEANCDYIIIIYLDANVRPSFANIQSDINERYHEKTLTEMSAESARTIYRENLRKGGLRYDRFPIPPAPFHLRQEQLLTVVPSRALGPAIDFRGGARTRDLMELGYNDMMAAMENHPLLRVR